MPFSAPARIHCMRTTIALCLLFASIPLCAQYGPPAKDLEHHNLPASATPTDPDAVAGKQAFESKCLACHSVGEGKKLGPDVAGVTKRRSKQWLARWLKEPEKMLQTDAVAKAMLKE